MRKQPIQRLFHLLDDVKELPDVPADHRARLLRLPLRVREELPVEASSGSLGKDWFPIGLNCLAIYMDKIPYFPLPLFLSFSFLVFDGVVGENIHEMQ